MLAENPILSYAVPSHRRRWRRTAFWIAALLVFLTTATVAISSMLHRVLAYYDKDTPAGDFPAR